MHEERSALLYLITHEHFDDLKEVYCFISTSTDPLSFKSIENKSNKQQFL